MTSEKMFQIRSATMGGAGLICALYAGLALLTGHPDPLPIWITGAAGLFAGAVIWIAALTAGRDVAEQSFDEGYRADARTAQRIGFWVAVWLYPLFGILLWAGWVTWPVAFASMGCLTAASYLLSATWLDMRGRGAC